MPSISSSSSSGADGRQDTHADASGFTVNFGNQNVMPSWIWIAAAVAGFLWLRKRT